MALLTRPRRLLALSLTAVLASLALATPVAVPAQSAVTSASEADIKAAFLYRFGSFVEWPATAFASPDSPFVIAVAGADEVAEALEAIVRGRTLLGRPIAVHRVRGGDPVRGDHVLFIGRDARRQFAALRDAVDGLPVLVVTELEDAVESGSMIDLVVDDGRVRFDVAPASAAANGLKISSRVLAIARRVEQRE